MYFLLSTYLHWASCTQEGEDGTENDVDNDDVNKFIHKLPIKKVEDDEKRNLENGDSDSHQHPDGHRHLARRNELHVRRKEILHGLIFKINQMYATTAPPYYISRWSVFIMYGQFPRSFPVMVIFGHFLIPHESSF